MSGAGFFVMNDVVYCDEHKPTSKLAALQMQPLKRDQVRTSDRCHVCGARP